MQACTLRSTEAYATGTWDTAESHTRDLLVHLYTTYGEIGPDDLKENEKRVKELYDATDAVEVLFDQIEDAVKFADNAAQPYTNLQVFRVVFNLMFDTRKFTRS